MVQYRTILSYILLEILYDSSLTYDEENQGVLGFLSLAATQQTDQLLKLRLQILNMVN